MMSPELPRPSEDAHAGAAAPAIAGWMAASGPRHGVTLTIAGLVIAGAHLAGARVDWRVYGVLALWIATNAFVARWALRPVAYGDRLRRYAWTIVADVLFLGATYYVLDAAQYMGVVFFAYMGLVASATLPRRWAAGIAALIVVVYTGLLLLAVYGPRSVASPIGLPPVTGNALFVVAGGASAVGMVLLLMRIQRLLIKSIRDAELRYVTLVQSASDMVVTFDEHGRFLDVNPATVAQSGYSWTELKEIPNRQLFPPGDWPAVRDAFERTRAGESVRLTVRYIRKDGEERWLHASTFLLTLDGKPATVVIARDVTDAHRQHAEREELRQRVADADRMESLGKLVSGVAHELNNPLAAILNFTEDLLTDARTPEERLALEVIQAQALRSRTIVRDLLTYARRDVTRPRVLVAPAPVLETVARAMRPGLAAQAVNFTVDTVADVPPIPLDRTGFEQVVTNLLTNAAHAAGSGGSVRLSSRVRPDAFEVSVEDNGPGVPPDLAAKIFEPFFTTKPTGHGVGLGLSVSLGIVQAHGGTLTVQNRAAEVGGGARFTLRLPLSDAAVAVPEHRHSGEHAVPMPRVAAARAPVAEPASEPRPMPERKRTILIIDDESAIRQGLRRYFTRKAWVVEESPDGADALARLLRPEAQRIYDVVLCDLKMAGVSGMDVYERMRGAAPALADRFILSTGDTSAPDVSGFLASVTVPVLEKPFELTALERLAEQVRTQSAASGPGSGRVPA